MPALPSSFEKFLDALTLLPFQHSLLMPRRAVIGATSQPPLSLSPKPHPISLIRLRGYNLISLFFALSLAPPPPLPATPPSPFPGGLISTNAPLTGVSSLPRQNSACLPSPSAPPFPVTLLPSHLQLPPHPFRLRSSPLTSSRAVVKMKRHPAPSHSPWDQNLVCPSPNASSRGTSEAFLVCAIPGAPEQTASQTHSSSLFPAHIEPRHLGRNLILYFPDVLPLTPKCTTSEASSSPPFPESRSRQHLEES